MWPTSPYDVVVAQLVEMGGCALEREALAATEATQE